MVNKSLGSLLRCLLGDPMFEYNNSVNKTTVMSSFEIFIGYKPKAPIDLLIPMSATYRLSESASVFA